MQGSWNNGKPHYRCNFLSQYAAKNKANQPTSVYLREEQMLPKDRRMDFCDRAIELDPDFDWAIADRGETFRAMGRYEEALADYNRAIELNPGHDDYIMKRAEIHRHIGPAEPTVLQTAPIRVNRQAEQGDLHMVDRRKRSRTIHADSAIPREEPLSPRHGR
ncbi:MAG: tetratricopeptide repeat protein [Actinobacteria bacterium]|nr:tetratricopeptide repeat protein [Actinomycetota bacterium]